MNPTAPTPQPTPENSSTGVRLPEVMPAAPSAPELAPVALQPAPLAAPATPVAMPPTPVPPVPGSSVTPMAPASIMPPTPMPVIAGDVDVIEKEWVDKADEVRKSTQGDPHAEEEAVEVLQQEYLKQRYGRDIGKPTDK